ncbi:putative Fe-S oxidoreductase [Streptococcus pneumoniae]|nr:putative Fe-S oxidoreductase [Streptococcus pneumoniae]
METVKRLRKYPKIEIVSHLINGLPGETHEMMVENVRRCVTNNDIQGIKLHLLHLMTNTRMQRDYHEGRLQLMSQDEYVRVICDQLEIIPKHIVIHRITGDTPRDMLIGLMWSLNKWEALNSIKMEQMQFNPLNIVIRDTTADIFNHHLIGFTRQTIDQMGNNLNFWILSQTLDRFHLQFIRIRTVNQVRSCFISSLQAQFNRHMHALR